MAIDDLRNQIDLIDRELLRLLSERQRIAAAIGESKRGEGRAIYAPGREESLLRKLEREAPDCLGKEAVRGIFKEIISASVGLQLSKPVVYLGPEGTFSHQAALKNFGHGVALMALRNIDEVFRTVETGEYDYGVVPVENASEGSVVRTLDLLAESSLKIVAQIYLPVEQCLVGRGPISKVRRVASKDIALDQCRTWLAANLPGAELLAVESTAGGVRLAADDDTVAAIASSVAAELAHLPVLASAIQDRHDNVTRFLVIAREANPPGAECEQKTSVVLSLKHRPGALQSALEPFSRRGINLTRVESRPARGRTWEYLFFIDFIGHREMPSVMEIFADLDPLCERVKWLGGYPNIG